MKLNAQKCVAQCAHFPDIPNYIINENMYIYAPNSKHQHPYLGLIMHAMVIIYLKFSYKASNYIKYQIL